MDPHPTFHRYVALGDSFTEGCGDPDPGRPNGVRGWADRVAEVLATRNADFGYANLAVRGRKLAAVVEEQLEPAVALRPDLVTMYAGANDIMRPTVDLDALATTYDAAAARLAATGAHLVLFTAFDPGHTRVHGPFRGRWALYTEAVREISDRHGATLVDYWRMRDYRSWGLWDEDRLHMNAAGHQKMAMAVLDRLGVAHDLTPIAQQERPRMSPQEARRANLEWARVHALPWVHRRLTGRSSGDSVTAKHPVLVPFAPPA